MKIILDRTKDDERNINNDIFKQKSIIFSKRFM